MTSDLSSVSSGSSGDESEGQTLRGGFRVFGRQAKIEWTAETESAAMQDLVERREVIFQQQRGLDNSRLQAESEKLAMEHLAQFSARNTAPASNLHLYKRFCNLVGVPPYPVTFPLLSLAMFAGCSTKNGHFATFKSDLQHVMQATASPWEGEAGYEVLVGMDRDGTALKEFMNERRKVRLKPQVGLSFPASFPRTGRPTTFSREDSWDEDSPSDFEHENVKSELRERVVQTPTPGLPQPRDSFDSPQAALAQVVKALVPVYGISARIEASDESSADIFCNRHHGHYRTKPGGRCEFRIHLELDEHSSRWIVDDELSHYEHNHNPDPRIVKDPTWRPTIRMKLARDALGMGPLVPKRSKSGKKRQAAQQESSEASETETSGEEEDEDERSPPPTKKRVKSVASTPTTRRSSTAIARPLATPTSLFKASSRPSSFPQLTPPAPTPSLSPSGYPAGPSRSSYAPASPLPVFTLPAPRQTGPAATTYPAVADLLSPADLVASFLAATHPSRIHLAPALVDAGFGSVEALGFFGCSLAPQAQEAVFAEVQRRLMLGMKL